MSPERWLQIKDLFFDALDRPSEERRVLLERSAGSESMIAEVESLLHAREKTSPLIDKRLHNLGDLLQPVDGDPFIGKAVNAYRIIRELGRGGMGTVYLAEQKEESFHRFVAMKVIRKGMDSDQVIHRFNIERQILAALNHANIARLLDGGTSPEGISYLVMEYIEGLPITTYCDSRRLSVQERLRLFQKVCAAVQYAHQNLIVHRDLKPSNILVTSQGDVKLLDFGIAKLLNPNLTPQGAMMTSAVHRLMTPEYASPEQVRGESVTTSSDVYALGVVLYELLSGHRPYRITSRVREDIRRLICEKEPTRPSTVVAQVFEEESDEETKTATPQSISEARGTAMERLRRQLHGDLDNIVLLAMRKEPQRRYSSAADLSRDIDRHLSGAPVVARRPTVFYKTQKFVKRHRFGVIASIAFAALFISFGYLYAVQLRQERDRAHLAAEEAERVTDFMLTVFQGSNAYEAKGDTVTAREVLDRGVTRIASELAGQPVVQARLFDAMGLSYQSLGLYERAGDLLERSLSLRETLPVANHLERAESYIHLANLHNESLEYAEAERFARRSLEIRREKLGPFHEVTLKSMHSVAQNLFELHELQEADSLLQITWKRRQSLLGAFHPQTIESLYLLGLVLHGRRNHEYAKTLLAETLTGFTPDKLEKSPETAGSLWRLARLMQFQNDHAGAERMYRKALEINESLYRSPHYEIANTLFAIATTLEWQGREEESLELYLKALDQHQSLYGEFSTQVAQTWSHIADSYEGLGRFEDAIAAHRKVQSIYNVAEPPRPSTRSVIQVSLARIFRKIGRIQDAERAAHSAIDSLHDKTDMLSRSQYAFANKELGSIRYDRHDYEEAEPFLRIAHDILQQYWSRSPNAAHAELKIMLGGVYVRQGRYEKAEEMLLDADSTVEKLFTRERFKKRADSLQRITIAELTRLYDAWGRPNQTTRVVLD